jgi:hypothetical protein
MVDAPFLNQMYLPGLKFHNASLPIIPDLPPYPTWNVAKPKFHNTASCVDANGNAIECVPTESKWKKVLNTLSDTFDILGSVTDSILQGNVTDPVSSLPTTVKEKKVLGMEPVAGSLVVVLIVATVATIGVVAYKKIAGKSSD